MAQGVHKITEQFEQELCKYTGAPFAVALDNGSNAIFLSLYYEINISNRLKTIKLYEPDKKVKITIPNHTYPSVPCEVIHAGGKVSFRDHFLYSQNLEEGSNILKGAYKLWPTRVIDSALRFTCDMYIKDSFMCLSFTGPYKHLKLGKGGAILTDNEEAYKWFKKARFSGRDECSYHEDDFDTNPVIGWNFYMPVETSTRGLHMIPQFYNIDGTKKDNPDLELPYPDLSKFKCYQ